MEVMHFKQHKMGYFNDDYLNIHNLESSEISKQDKLEEVAAPVIEWVYNREYDKVDWVKDPNKLYI